MTGLSSWRCQTKTTTTLLRDTRQDSLMLYCLRLTDLTLFAWSVYFPEDPKGRNKEGHVELVGSFPLGDESQGQQQSRPFFGGFIH